MPKLFMALCLVLFVSSCTPVPRLPIALGIQIENGTPTKPSVCSDGIQVILSKGVDVWTSPMVANGQKYDISLDTVPLSAETEFIFKGDKKLTVNISCKNGLQTGSGRFIVQAILPLFSIRVDGGKGYEKLVVDNLRIIEVTPEVLPLPSILFESET